MPGVHDYSKFIKRGYGRSTDFVSQDVRNGLMTREEAFKSVGLSKERMDKLFKAQAASELECF